MERRDFLRVAGGLAAASLARSASPAPPARIVVVGGGIVGASIAFHLARRGAQVTLCEKLRPACGATEKSFAWINATFSKQPRAYYELNLLGMAAWRWLADELRGALHVQWGGSAEWYPVGDEAEQLRRDVRRHQAWGYAARLVDVEELGRLLPGVSPGPVGAASFSEAEGAVDPVEAVGVLLERAREDGARLLHPCEVRGLDLTAKRVRSVRTSDGELPADVVVLACGVDTPRVAAMAGVNVPLKDSPGVLAHTKPQPRLMGRVALAPGAHIMQRTSGVVVTGSSFGGTPLTDPVAVDGKGMLAEAARFLPGMSGAALDHVTVGWRVMPSDELPIAGFAEACPNVYVAAMHSGVTLAPLIGQFAAEEILDGARIDLLQPFRLARFGS